MKRGIALLTALAALACVAPGLAIALPQPANLYVQGGEAAWHPDPEFVIGWRDPEDPGLDVSYSVSDASGHLVREADLDWPAYQVAIEVPPKPGVYTFKVHYAKGNSKGPATEAKLRFDDAEPGALEPHAPADWISRDDFPLTIRLGPPAGPLPLSGLRGYAIAFGEAPGTSPCGLAGYCTEAETDVRDGDELTVTALPEGDVAMAAVAVSGAGLASPDVAERTLRVDTSPPRVRLRGLPSGWTRGPVRLAVAATDTGSGMGGPRAFTAISIDGSVPKIAPGAAEAGLIEEGVHRVAYWAGDAAGNADDGARVNGHLNPPPRTATVRIDRTPPRASFLSRDPTDRELLRVRISDSRSGADPARSWVGVRPLGSRERFRRLPAVVGGRDELRARWDSAAYPLGRYEFRAEARDQAGNRAATTRLASGAAMVLSNPVKTPTTLLAGFGGSVLRWHRCRRVDGRRRCARQTVADFDHRPARRIVPFGRGMRFSGRLRVAAGGEPGPRPVRIAERVDGGTRPSSKAWIVWTEPDGSFTTRLAPGPSREVVATYAGDRVLGASAGTSLRLGVRSGVRLRTSARVARVGGAPLVFSGRVLSQPGEISDGGIAVQLQFRLPGGAWEEFRTVESDRRGRFRLPYRFSDDDSRGARFQFRARVPKQSQWPYEAGNSRPIAVKGL